MTETYYTLASQLQPHFTAPAPHHNHALFSFYETLQIWSNPPPPQTLFCVPVFVLLNYLEPLERGMRLQK